MGRILSILWEILSILWEICYLIGIFRNHSSPPPSTTILGSSPWKVFFENCFLPVRPCKVQTQLFVFFHCKTLMMRLGQMFYHATVTIFNNQLRYDRGNFFSGNLHQSFDNKLLTLIENKFPIININGFGHAYPLLS